MKKIIAIILSLSIGTGAIIYVASREKIDVSNNDTTFVTNADKVEETTSASNEVSTLIAEENTTVKESETSTQANTKQSETETTTKKNKETSPVKPGKTNIDKNNVTPSTTEDETTQDYLKYYDKWEKSIDVYEHDNVEVSKNWDKYAYISVYTTECSKAKETQLKKEFEKAFGFKPTGAIECNYEGYYVVDGYNEPQNVYHYCIYDCTYPLLEDELGVVKKKICTDGSPWVGFVMRTDETSSYRCDQLREESYKVFYEWTGYDSDYMRGNDNFAVGNMIWSTARTENNELIEIVYIFTRAYGIKTDINGNPIKL